MRFMWLGGFSVLGLLPMTASAGHVSIGVGIGFPYIGIGIGGYHHHYYYRGYACASVLPRILRSGVRWREVLCAAGLLRAAGCL